jgi:uncharacterized FlaG/YvyC family protein
MIEGVQGYNGGSQPRVDRTSGTAPVGTPRFADVAAAAVTEVPAHPPAEVLESLNKAARVLNELARNKVEMHIEVDGSKRVRVQLRDAEGKVVREIPATKALDILAGDRTGFAVDARG